MGNSNEWNMVLLVHNVFNHMGSDTWIDKESVSNQNWNRHVSPTTPKDLAICLIFSICHNCLCSISTVNYLYGLFIATNSCTHIALTLHLTIASCAYFTIATVYEGGWATLGYNSSMMCTMIIHHIATGFVLTCSFLTNPILLQLCMFGLQSEISNIFMNGHDICRIFGQKTAYYRVGIAYFITYFVTRIIVGPCGVYYAYLHRKEVIEASGLGVSHLYMFGSLFILLMSYIQFFGIMMPNAKEFMILKNEENKHCPKQQ